MFAAFVNVASIFHVPAIDDLPEKFFLYDFRKTDDRIERSAQLMGHARKEL